MTDLLVAARLSTMALSRINTVLSVFVALLLLLFFVQVTLYFGAGNRIGEVMARVPDVSFRPTALQAFRPLDDYLLVQTDRDMFYPVASTAPATAVTVTDRRAAFKRALASISLLGIIQGKSPKVIINNKAENKILYIAPGTEIEGTGIRVKEVLRGKVKVSYGTLEAEL